jgi:hypothetical protein
MSGQGNNTVVPLRKLFVVSSALRALPMKRSTVRIALFVAVLIALPFNAFAWNIPGHMLSGAIAYQIRQHESPNSISVVTSILKNNPRYERRWKLTIG